MTNPRLQEDIVIDLLANLVAAISLLKRGSKKAAPSDRMFDQMIVDYERSVERGRVFLSGGVAMPIEETLPGRLAKELIRVAAICEHYREIGRIPRIITEPAISQMTQALDAGIKALESGDPAAQILALNELHETEG